jgi:hypothetical protein
MDVDQGTVIRWWQKYKGRTDMSEATDIIHLWDERDQRYAMRRIRGIPAALSEAEISSVREWRMKEANEMSIDQRDIALVELAQWTPPAVAKR